MGGLFKNYDEEINMKENNMLKYVATKIMAYLTTVMVAWVFSSAWAGGVLKRGNGGEPASLDPHFASGTWENNIIGDMFMGLTTIDSKGGLIPGLAKSWSVSADGLTYTFKLRNAMWSDGRAITAEDFVYSFKRILNPQTAAKYSFMLHPIKGAVAYNKGEGSVNKLAVKALDKHTLEIKLVSPAPYFLESLSHYTAWAVPKHVVEKKGKKWAREGNIVVSGAFILKSWVPNSIITLVKNDKFFDAQNVALDGVEFYAIEKRVTELKRWEAGELHTTDEIPGGMTTQLREKYGDQLRISPRLGTYYYALNSKVIKDRRIREAMSLALNREIITDKITASGEIPAYSWVAPGTNNYSAPPSQVAMLRFKNWSQARRMARAKQLMKEVGYNPSKPLLLKLSYNTSDSHKKIAVAAASMWKAIGIKIEMSNVEVKIHYDQLQEGKFEVGRAGWIGDYNDPYTFLELLQTDNSNNYGNYSNPEYDRLMKKASTMAGDLQVRAKLMHQAEQIMLDDHAVIPVYYYVNKELVNRKVKGWDENLDGTHRSRFVSLQP